LGGNPSYINPNSFSTNGNMLLAASAASLGAAGSVFAGDNGLGSNAARMSFAHAGALQQQQQQQQHGQQQGHGMLGEHVSRNQTKGRIREVWKHNLNEEMANLRDLVDKYPYIAMVGCSPSQMVSHDGKMIADG
jgi:CCR4-NOT transcription complex subunit 7/8